jgi:iron complex outermembrane recepter protein
MTSKFFLHVLAGASALACASLCVAQSSPAPANSSNTNISTNEPVLAPITITANPLGGSDLIAPSQTLLGTGLLLRQQSTLGEVLQGLPGVSSTYFGPNASRPIIRGLDGDRIRILSNSGATLDASGLSFDHAVALDPIAVERVEVLRGPGALLYGGSAVGGVVNVIDNRIPKARIQGFSGKADVGFSSGNEGKNGAFLLEGGSGNYALHADVSARSNGEVSRPDAQPCRGADLRKICNSAADAQSGAIGGSVFFDRGYLGLATTAFNTKYGTVAEEEVTIRMRSQRTAVEGEVKLGGWLQSLKGQLSHTDYKHTEFEGSEVGTVFTNKGHDARLELRHAPLGPLEGVVGLQLDNNRFSALGDEAFAPLSKTRQSAIFIYEEIKPRWGKLSFGGRLEDVKVQSLGNPDVARFVPDQRNFKPASFALGALVPLNPQWQITGNAASTQRAPKDYELFADGPHIATAAYEVGSSALRKEKSNSLDLGLRWSSGAHQVQINVFATRFKNYILLDATGNTRGIDAELNPLDADGDGIADGSGEEILPEFAYSQVRARFHGFEASGNWRLLDTANKLDLQWRLDSTRATNVNTGAPLPRISPLRTGATLVWTQGPWSARVGFDRNAKARDNSAEGYTLWNLAATWRMKAKDAQLQWFARLDNATDKLAYSATSILTTSAPNRSPLPGRSFKLGLQAVF